MTEREEIPLYKQNGKFWCFTQNPEPDQFRINLETFFQAHTDMIQYICGQIEIGGNTEHRHFQGYMQLKISKRGTWVKTNLLPVARLAKQKASRTTSARDYCHKEDDTTVEGTFVECGEFLDAYAQKGSGAGKRNDIHELRDAIKEEKTERYIIEDDSLVVAYAKYQRFHDRTRMLYRPKNHPEGVHVILHFGDPGTGKTRNVFNRYPDVFEIPISNGTMWMDGYDGHEEVLFDDFLGAASKLPLDTTLKFFDRYVRSVPIKGGHTWYRPKVINITTNYHPRAWYEYASREPSWEALCRRFHEIWVYETDKDAYEVIPADFLEDREYWPNTGTVTSWIDQN